MRVQTVCAGVVGCLLGLMVTVMAQNTPKLELFGDRFKPLTYDGLTPEQKRMTDNILNSERKSMGGPFNALLRSPEMGDLAQQLGAYVRFRSSVPRHLNEMAIIMTARVWTAQYEWYVHKQAALDAGLNPAIAAAIAENKRPASMKPDEQALYEFIKELLETKHVSDATFQNAVKAFGEKGVVDLIGLTGYYGMVSALLNVDRYPLPAGAKPELAPLR
ncbi:MAG: carboxymuconolactone decarboxylase family protein [Acidobacteriota bacterium]